MRRTDRVRSEIRADRMGRLNLIGSGDELVSRVSLYKSRHPALHGYTSPFIALYLAWLYT